MTALAFMGAGLAFLLWVGFAMLIATIVADRIGEGLAVGVLAFLALIVPFAVAMEVLA